MLSWLAKYLFAATSISPVCITLAFVAYLNDQTAVLYITIAIFIVSTFIFIYILIHIKTEIAKTKINIVSISPANKEITGYFLSYLFPLILGDSLVKDWKITLFFYITFFIYVGFSTSYNFNPLLSIFYRFYNATDSSGRTVILLAPIRNKGKKVDEIRTGTLSNLFVTEITPYMYLMIGEN